MERDYGQEIDKLQQQLDDIKTLLTSLVTGQKDSEDPQPENPKQLKNIHPMRNMHPNKHLSQLMEGLCSKADEDSETGAITYLGVFASGGRQSNWIRNEVSTDELLRLIESGIASKVLASVGSNERLRILLALLKSPKSVAQLIEQCGYSSSGQVYHHLKPLLAANLIKEDEKERGFYVVVPHRVQGIIMMLAGISDMLDPKYTDGNWDFEQ